MWFWPAVGWGLRRVEDAHEILEKPVYAGEFNLPVDKTRNDAAERLADKRAAYRAWYDTYDRTDADGAFFWTVDGHDWPTGRLNYQFNIEHPEDREFEGGREGVLANDG